ncbi:MAG: chromosome partitioning protein ParB [Rickettsiales bacterium]|nr:chromosome partitioning protein ParB [Rickettsiales bacterium]|tara:strand:- start:316 stop:1158 length:843 start_codon:yes stop_codon:yes gene_type:complete
MTNTFKLKKGLGRGLSSLIGDSSSTAKSNNIPISSIIRNKFQPRKNFNREQMNELTNSIRERGIIQPIVVRKKSDKYEIIAGERRWQAAQNAGLHEVPIVEIQADDLKSLEFAIVENVQRDDLNAIEEANGYKRLIDEFEYDQEKVAKFIGKSRAHIANSLRLLTLPSDVIKLIEDQKLSQGHAKVLVGLENANIIAKKIVDKKLSVRQAESLVRIYKSPKKFKVITNDSNIKALEKSLQEKTGLVAKIHHKKNNKGVITFEYNNTDQLDRLVMVVKANY